MRVPVGLYRLLSRTWPAALRAELGGEPERAYEKLVAASRRKSRGAYVVAVLAGLCDVLLGGIRFRLRPSLVASLSGAGPAADMTDRGNRREIMGTMLADIRGALRAVTRRPVFALTAMITLALGIGANTAIFSVVYGLLFRPFPYEAEDRLAMIWNANHERGWTNTDVSPWDVNEWQTRSNSFADLAVIGRGSLNLTGQDRPERLEAKFVTANLFSILGVSPVVGRDFEPADAEPGAPYTAIVSWGLWQRRFGGDAAVIGSVIQLDGKPCTIIGVMARDFAFYDGTPDVFVPLQLVLAEASPSNHAYNAIGRLRDGVSVDVASGEIESIAATLAEEYPETHRGWTAYVVSLRDQVVGEVGRQAATVLMGAVLFVLLMACVNVANLLLARANGRRREMAVRSALGARRMRVIRQLLVESLVLAIGGGVLGVFIAHFGVRAIAAGMPSNAPVVFAFEVDSAALVFALIASLFATLLFGLMPALRASSASGIELREDGRGSEGRRSRRFGGTLVVVQTALAVVLLVGGGIMMRSVSNMQEQDLGYDPDGVLTMRVTPPDVTYPDGAALNRFYGDVLERVRALPGVGAAGTIQSLPLRGSNNVSTFAIVGETAASEDGYPARMGYLSTGYLQAMRVNMVRGRDFAETDRVDAAPVALVNETLARQRFADGDPIGREIEVNGQSRLVVGVVPDMLERSVTRAPEPSIYLPVTQASVRSRSLAIRTAGVPAALAEAVQREIMAVDPTQPAYEIQPMNALLDMRVGPFRLIASLMLAFAAVSLVLGAVGIYGVTAYAVGRRTGEIGIRLAIGAERKSVVRMIVREGMTRAAIGLGIGLALAFPLARAMQGLLVGVSPNDPMTFTSVIALLAAVTFLGAWLPARRASRLDPVRALSHE